MFALSLIQVLACGPDPQDTAPHVQLPAHSQCFAVGHIMDPEVCVAVVEEDDRYPTVPENKSGISPDPDDPRITDPDLLWLQSEIERCTCVCCHREQYGGPGVYFYDLDHGPVWIDSASGWTLDVLSGQTNNELQTLPSTDQQRVVEIVEREMQRRYDAD